ncbi:hypothetical protein LA03_12115 [Burkholderia gladioli]|nr:hypothetical protein LA03_12115 [Burkholderia gladioli]
MKTGRLAMDDSIVQTRTVVAACLVQPGAVPSASESPPPAMHQNTKMSAIPTQHGSGPAWKSAQIARLGTALDSLCGALVAIDKQYGEIIALRRAVCESARALGKRRPHMTEVAHLLEATFALTAPAHLSMARRLAVEMRCILEQAIASLRELPDADASRDASCRVVGSAMADLVHHCDENAVALSKLLGNAEHEIQVLQALFLELSGP